VAIRGIEFVTYGIPYPITKWSFAVSFSSLFFLLQKFYVFLFYTIFCSKTGKISKVILRFFKRYKGEANIFLLDFLKHCLQRKFRVLPLPGHAPSPFFALKPMKEFILIFKHCLPAL